MLSAVKLSYSTKLNRLGHTLAKRFRTRPKAGLVAPQQSALANQEWGRRYEAVLPHGQLPARQGPAKAVQNQSERSLLPIAFQGLKCRFQRDGMGAKKVKVARLTRAGPAGGGSQSILDHCGTG